MKRIPLIATFAHLVHAAFASDLASLAKHQDFTAHRESSYDRSGGNGDNIPVAPGETKTIADIRGNGCITHIWFTHLYHGRTGLRKLVLRAYFDDSETPCIESPLGDFFGLGHSQTYAYASEPLAVATWGGLNSYWRMPFSKRARFTITNEGRQHCPALYYYIDYQRYSTPREKQPCFHAHYRQAMPCVKGEPYTILEAQGRGHYVGCNLSIEQREDSWWGEGDDRLYIDGETTPSIIGTGSEDYFGGAWCYWNEFGYPYIGMPLRARPLANGTLDHYFPHLSLEQARKEWHWPVAWRKGDLWNVYRYHVKDPVPFQKSLRLDIEHGYIDNERVDAYSSVAYWYQDEPHAPQPALPPAIDRLPHFLRPQLREGNLMEGEDLVDLTTATAGAVTDNDMGFFGDAWSRRAMLRWAPEKDGDVLEVPFELPHETTGGLTVRLAKTREAGIFDISLDDKVLTSGVDLHSGWIMPASEKLELHKEKTAAGRHVLKFVSRGKNGKSEGSILGVDALQF